MCLTASALSGEVEPETDSMYNQSLWRRGGGGQYEVNGSIKVKSGGQPWYIRASSVLSKSCLCQKSLTATFSSSFKERRVSVW